MTDEVLAAQVDYYRRRAGEYDVTAYGDVAAARARIARLVAEMRPAGRVLEIACGTGLWTQAVAGWADTVMAIDAAPEAVAIARERVRSASVSFEVADVFSWDPGTRFDVIFSAAWLSHVPASRFGQFWQLLGRLLAGNGRVLFIDEHVDERGKEAYVAGRDEVVERRRALTHLAAAGRVGFDLATGAYFHRELPYRPAALQVQHPRLRDARALAEAGKVTLGPTDALVRSGTTTYVVRSTPDGDHCTCTWFGAHGSSRGPCKHALAARIARQAQTAADAVPPAPQVVDER